MCNPNRGERCGPGFGHFPPFPEHFPPQFGMFPPFPGFKHGFHHHRGSFRPYSLEATDTQYIVKIPLPGHEVKDINVSVKKNFLLIETKQVEEEVPPEKVRKIRSFGEFFWNKPQVELMIPVHEEIDPATVQAKLSRGILTVTFARKPGTKVEVQE